MTDRDQVIKGLRELADWLDGHPDIPAPNWGVSASVYLGLAETRKARKGAGPWRKNATEGSRFGPPTAVYYREFSGEVSYLINTVVSNKCRKIVVGTEEVPAVPATTQDVVKWECG